jgi:hypothetical protein
MWAMRATTTATATATAMLTHGAVVLRKWQ